MRHLVAEHRPDAPVVPRIAVADVEERRLQDTGWNPKPIVGGAVEGVDRGGRAPPPLPPVGLARQVPEALLDLQPVPNHLVGVELVPEQTLERDRLLGPVLLALGVRRHPDLEEHLVQLVLRCLPILVRHPPLHLELRRKLRPDLLEHGARRRHVGPVEDLVRVQLGSRPRRRVEGAVVALAGAGALLLDAVYVLLEVHERVEELLGERGARRVHQLPAHQGLDGFGGVRLDDGPELLEEGHVLHQQGLAPLLARRENRGVPPLGAHAGAAVGRVAARRKLLEPLLPQPVWRRLLHLFPRNHRPVVAARHHAVVEGGGDVGLELHDELGLLLGLLAADEPEEVSDALLQLGAVPLHLVAVLGVVGLVRESHRRLGEEEGPRLVVGGVPPHVPREEVVDVVLVKGRHRLDKALLVRDAVNHCEPRLERLRTLLVHVIQVHARLVVGAHGALVGLEELLHRVADAVRGLVPSQPHAALVRGDLVPVLLCPRAARELVKVVAGVGLARNGLLDLLWEGGDHQLRHKLPRLIAHSLHLRLPPVRPHEPHLLKLLDQVAAVASLRREVLGVDLVHALPQQLHRPPLHGDTLARNSDVDDAASGHTGERKCIQPPPGRRRHPLPPPCTGRPVQGLTLGPQEGRVRHHPRDLW
mmetsp:Transcript_31160/g.72841  ORF Transcript_31160/g.72841 Transcript_31160/m.72841 type:complete len:646 (+) Transcript_31160:515-2452(+)